MSSNDIETLDLSIVQIMNPWMSGNSEEHDLDLTPQDILEPGDIVRLKDPYKGFDFGIVTEIVTRYDSGYRNVDEMAAINPRVAPPAVGAPRNDI